MELSKVLDGFIDADTLIIKAQVQVIREKADRPFRCLDCQYRRELVRVYLTNVEQICRRFVEERRSKLGKLIEDKARWSSFSVFWSGIDQIARRRMSREKTDSILKVVVKHFFIEKEVTSTLVMDSLYSGLKALEGQTKSKKGRVKLLEAEEMPAPIVRVEKDTFVLVDDVLSLLERAAMEPLPPKDEKGPQNRTKDGNSGEDFNKDSIERDERRLTELGRRTVEIFVLAHIFSNKIEVAYQEAVALKRQEELIREEEAAWQAESEQKAKRGEKEKKSKKKQGKQKRNNRKGKDKGREERPGAAVQDQYQQDNPSDECKNSPREEMQPVLEKLDTLEDVSDVSDSIDGGTEVQPDSEDRDASPVNWDTDTSEVQPSIETSSSCMLTVQNGMSDKKNQSLMDDSSSTCSTDSVPSVVMNGPYKGNSFPNLKNQKSPSRGKNQRGKLTSDGNSWANEVDGQVSGPTTDAGDTNEVSGSGKNGDSESEVVLTSLDHVKCLEQHVAKKEEEAVSLQKKSVKDQVEIAGSFKEKRTAQTSIPGSPPKSPPSTVQPRPECQTSASMNSVQARKVPLNGPQPMMDRGSPLTTSQVTLMVKPETQKAAAQKVTEKAVAQQLPVMSRPSSAPLIPGQRPTAPVVSMVQTSSPLLARSMSAAGRLGPEPSPATHSYVPQSYRNAIMGNHVSSSSAGFSNTSSPSSGGNQSPAYSQPPTLVSSPIYLPQSSERMDPGTMKSGYPFAMVGREGLHNGPQWLESSQREAEKSMNYDHSMLLNDVQNLGLYNKPLTSGSRDHLPDFSGRTSGRQPQGLSAADEFPHLDIINDLLDDTGPSTRVNSVFESQSNGPNSLNRQFSYPGDLSTAGNMGSSSSSCRFERTRSYHDDVLHRNYSSSGGHYEAVREFIPQAGPLPYVNGQIDGLIPNQWQMPPASDMSLVVMRNAESEGYPYYNPDYSNVAVNGYAMFRPSNGH
ncbi:TNF receptor-associated factor homolog 1b-like isoform X2 [Humulus lupulus]|nr:TNF receptor-associated factor homolog 1b-like isoform X2 [Humulus lupulus]XP_062108159.1 TNF receptor-associated factor homolog 1b-like isoform X2 [Humulus lupulus]